MRRYETALHDNGHHTKPALFSTMAFMIGN